MEYFAGYLAALPVSVERIKFESATLSQHLFYGLKVQDIMSAEPPTLLGLFQHVENFLFLAADGDGIGQPHTDFTRLERIQSGGGQTRQCKATAHMGFGHGEIQSPQAATLRRKPGLSLLN